MSILHPQEFLYESNSSSSDIIRIKIQSIKSLNFLQQQQILIQSNCSNLHHYRYRILYETNLINQIIIICQIFSACSLTQSTIDSLSSISSSLDSWIYLLEQSETTTVTTSTQRIDRILPYYFSNHSFWHIYPTKKSIQLIIQVKYYIHSVSNLFELFQRE